MADLQVPVAVGTSGQRLDVSVVNVGSTIYRQIISLGDPLSTQAIATVTSSGGLTVNLSTQNIHVVVVSTSSPVILSSGGLTQIQVAGTQATPSIAPVTSSGGLTVSLSTGNVHITVVATSGPINISSGTVTLSSTPLVQTASSSIVQTVPSSGQQYTVFQFANSSSSWSITMITSNNKTLYGWSALNQTTSTPAAIKLYNSSSAGITVGSTSGLILTIGIPGAANGAGNNMTIPQGVNFSSYMCAVITRDYASTSTAIAHSAGDIACSFYFI